MSRQLKLAIGVRNRRVDGNFRWIWVTRPHAFAHVPIADQDPLEVARAIGRGMLIAAALWLPILMLLK
jgi:hypothetical protein